MEFIDRLRKQRIYQKFLKENLPVNKDNEWLLCKELSSMLKSGNRTLVYSVLDYSLWTEESYQCFLKLYKKDPECVEKILKSAPDLFETDVFDMFDLTLFAKVTDIEKFSELYKKINNKEKLLKLYHLPMNEEEQSYMLNHNVWLQKLLDSSMPAEEILSSLSLWPKILSNSDEQTQEQLFDLLSKNLLSEDKIKEFSNLTDFKKQYQVNWIGRDYEPMIANMTADAKKKLSDLVSQDPQILREISHGNELKSINDIKNDHLQLLYLEMTPESELMKKPLIYKYKIFCLLFGEDINNIYSLYKDSWKEILYLAKQQGKDGLVSKMKTISHFCLLNDSKQIQEFYHQHQKDDLLNVQEVQKQLKQIYVDHLNDGLFDPKTVPDEEGNYGKYEVSYVMYENKPIKKIIVRDPDFYMDISNVRNQFENDPQSFGDTNIQGSNTICTSLICRKHMNKFCRQVTGGISSIDSTRLIVSSKTDAGTYGKGYTEKSEGIKDSKISMLTSKKLVHSNQYNEVTSHRYYKDPDTGKLKKQGFDYMVTFPHSKLTAYNDVYPDRVLAWASTYNIPWVEIDGEFMYKYSEMEFKNFVTKVHESPEMIVEEDVSNVIQMFCAMDNFQYEELTHPYVFTETIDYMINWEQKEHNLETLERLQNMFQQMEDHLLFEDIHYTDEEKKKIKENDGDYRARLREIKMEEKLAWKSQWIARIQNEMVLQSEQHKAL